jgi:hypothetical protein
LAALSWSSEFDDPIPGMAMLRDAALYITKLPKPEHDTQEWQAAMEALLLAAELDLRSRLAPQHAGLSSARLQSNRSRTRPSQRQLPQLVVVRLRPRPRGKAT